MMCVFCQCIFRNKFIPVFRVFKPLRRRDYYLQKIKLLKEKYVAYNSVEQYLNGPIHIENRLASQ